MINPNDILFVGQTNHMLAAIENESIPGGTHFNFDEKKYYIAETAGPGRHAFGEKGKDYQSAANFEKLIFNHVVNTPPTKNKETKLSTDNKYFTLQIENLCKYTVKLIIRYKNIKGEWVFSDWTTLQKKDISSPLSTQEKYFYLYAESKKIIWKGNEKYKYNGKEISMMKLPVENDQSGSYTLRLRCK